MVAIQYLSNVYKKCFCTSSKSHVLINNIEGNFKKGGDGGPNSFPFLGHKDIAERDPFF